jgi:hypothetical protein
MSKRLKALIMKYMLVRQLQLLVEIILIFSIARASSGDPNQSKKDSAALTLC